MKQSTFCVVFSLAILLSFSGSAFARWQVNAVWQINNSSVTFTGTGDSQESALISARQQCTNKQSIDEYKYFCQNQPVRVDYGSLPEGTFYESCYPCRVDNTTNTLICGICKPVMEERRLDLNSCNGDTNHIANCHGALTCNECP